VVIRVFFFIVHTFVYSFLPENGQKTGVSGIFRPAANFVGYEINVNKYGDYFGGGDRNRTDE
jgi:hypothetical protein